VAPHGIYCSFDDPFVEVLCHVTALGNDFYELDRHGLRLVGRRSGASYGLGDRLTVRLESVNVSERSILAAPVVYLRPNDFDEQSFLPHDRDGGRRPLKRKHEEQKRSDRTRDERGRSERGRNERGRDERARDERGQGQRRQNSDRPDDDRRGAKKGSWGAHHPHDKRQTQRKEEQKREKRRERRQKDERKSKRRR
jgi:hypothetical protein